MRYCLAHWGVVGGEVPQWEHVASTDGFQHLGSFPIDCAVSPGSGEWQGKVQRRNTLVAILHIVPVRRSNTLALLSIAKSKEPAV